jgi:hypothetical protein
MEKFKELVLLCKASVEISVNNNKDYYQTAKEYIEGQSQMNKDIIEEIGEDVYNEMIKRDIVVEIQAYPNTPIGSYKIYHYDIDMAMDEMLNTIRNCG